MAGLDPAGADALVERARIAVLVPCLNEQGSVAKVVCDFKAALPGATVYVYDNDSEDATSTIAREAGAVVRREPRRGKGNVVRRMFADIEADVYVMVDGDDTYDAPAAREMISSLIENNLDMVVGGRSSHVEAASAAAIGSATACSRRCTGSSSAVSSRTCSPATARCRAGS